MEKEEEFFKICKRLKALVEKTGEQLEGNCVYKHLSFDKWDILSNKRINYQEITKKKTTVCEIGFNAGHSLLTMLLVNTKAQYVLFDIGEHKYSKPCLEYLRFLFPETEIEMIWGDSKLTIPIYIKENPEVKFDVIHIDGSHQYETYSQDWKNSVQMLRSGGCIIFDDTDNPKINNFIDTEIEKNKMTDDTERLETFGYKHRIIKSGF